MIGRLGKAAAEIALQFMSEGMNLDDAVRAGAKLMDEELSPAAEMMLKQNKRIRNRFLEADSDPVWRSLRSKEEAQQTANQMYSPDILKRTNSRAMKDVTDSTSKAGLSPSIARRRWTEYMDFGGDVVSAANGYAIRQLLLDAAEGDPAIAAVLAKRLGFEGLL